LSPTPKCAPRSPGFAGKGRSRGFDSIHLASFAEVVRRAGPDDARFSSFDERLNQAAKTLTRTLERAGRK
jgi:hypothetical protein